MRVLLQLLRVIMFPLALVYDAITRLRNHLYNSGYKPSFKFEVFTICVGNLNVGGAGKTPMVEYLIRLLGERYHVATLSRGYGRGTKGFRLAAAEDDARTLGDEPFQFYRKFGDRVKVAVGEDRALAIPNILHEHPDVKIVVMDDAFQHRSVQPHFSILLSEYAAPFFHDFVMPTGNLREARRGASRANVVVITKCPQHLPLSEREHITNQVKEYAGAKPVFFSTIVYGEPVSFGANKPITPSVILVSGIAHANSLATFLRSKYEIIKHFHFQDHHSYLEDELKAIVALSIQQQCAVLTTEKDMVRLISPHFQHYIEQVPLFYVPIQTSFIENGPDFDKIVLDRASAPLE